MKTKPREEEKEVRAFFQEKLEITSDCLLVNVHMLPVSSKEAKQSIIRRLVRWSDREKKKQTKTFYQQLYSEKTVCGVKIEDYVTSLPKLTEIKQTYQKGLLH